MIKDEYYLDPSTLDPVRRARREVVLAKCLEHVAGAEDSRVIVATLKCLMTGDESLLEMSSICASALEGTWHLTYESWQGHGQEHYFARGVYIHEENACIVSADAEPEGRIEIDSIWLSVEELQAMGRLM